MVTLRTWCGSRAPFGWRLVPLWLLGWGRHLCGGAFNLVRDLVSFHWFYTVTSGSAWRGFRFVRCRMRAGRTFEQAQQDNLRRLGDPDARRLIRFMRGRARGSAEWAYVGGLTVVCVTLFGLAWLGASCERAKGPCVYPNQWVCTQPAEAVRP